MLCTGDALALEVYARISGKTIVEIGNLTFCHEAGAWGSQSRQREVIPAAGTWPRGTNPAADEDLQTTARRRDGVQESFPIEFLQEPPVPSNRRSGEQFPFTAFMEWQASRGLDPDGAAGPPLLQGSSVVHCARRNGRATGCGNDEDGPTAVGVVPAFPRRPLQEALDVSKKPTPLEVHDRGRRRPPVCSSRHVQSLGPTAKVQRRIPQSNRGT